MVTFLLLPAKNINIFMMVLLEEKYSTLFLEFRVAGVDEEF